MFRLTPVLIITVFGPEMEGEDRSGQYIELWEEVTGDYFSSGNYTLHEF